MVPPADREAVVALARSQLGIHEQPANSNRTPYTEWYGLTGAWCAMFVSWVFWHAGHPLPPITTSKGFAYCPDGVAWAKANDCWAAPGSDPRPGDVVFFDFPRDGVGRVSHVGIVAEKARMTDGRVHTIEGNTNGAGSRTGGNVMEHYRSVAGGIVGYLTIDSVEEDDMDSTQDQRLKDVERHSIHTREMVEAVIMPAVGRMELAIAKITEQLKPRPRDAPRS